MTTQIRDGETLDALLDELTDLASTAPMSGPFFLAILDVALKTTNAHAGAIWSVVGVNYRLEQEVGLVRLGIGTDSQLQKLHEDALECESTGPIAAIPTRSETELTERSHDGNRYRFFGCRDRNLAYLVIELVHEENAIVPADPGLVGRIMAALSEIARDYRNAQTLQRLQSEDVIWNDFKSILPQLHSSIHLEESAQCIANEGRKFLRCDRLSVAIFDKNKATIVAVSGVATIERRAKQVRELESLVALVARSGSSLRYPSTEVEAPQLAEGLQRYLDESHDERIWISLMFREPSTTDSSQSESELCIGALVIETFDIKEAPELALRSELLLQHGGIAIQNALAFDRLPLKRLSQALSRLPITYQSYRVKGLIGLVVGLLCLALAVVIPADLNMHANGTIQPLAMHHVYAPANGEVVQIHASHHSQVQTGDLLVEIRSREMELRKEELLTQRATTQEKLRGIEVARLRDRKQTNAESASMGELSASERELREVMASQDAQLSILGEMLASLQLKSPVSGHVISWDPAETLDRRPVQQGQKLLSVAELDGDGRLQLRVLDEDTRHVINASKVNASKREQESIRVTFSIASDPGIRHTAVVHRIGTMIETVTEEGATLRIDAVVAAADMRNVRPGATVNAKIHCGRSSIGYVWTRRFWDFLLFRLL